MSGDAPHHNVLTPDRGGILASLEFYRGPFCLR
jgi:hypothetical protein